jgi:hypothetical protein
VCKLELKIKIERPPPWPSSLYLINLLIEILRLLSVEVQNNIQNDIFRHHKFSNRVNNIIININSLFISNLLSFHIDKTQFLQFLS